MGNFRNDRRGLAVGIIAFFAMIIIGALIFTLFNEALLEVFSMTKSQAQTQHGTDQIAQAETIWNWVLAWVLGVAVLFIIARAVVESRGPGV